MYDTLRGAGFEPRTTPIDTLMAAPVGTGLAVAEAMEAYDDTDDLPEGFQEWDAEDETFDNLLTYNTGIEP